MSEASIPAVVATQRINGTILPGVIFTPATQQDHDDLTALGAIREPTEAELLLHEKMQSNAAAPAKPARTPRKPAAQTPAAGSEAGNGEAGAEGAGNGEAGNGEAGNGEAGNGEAGADAEANIG